MIILFIALINLHCFFKSDKIENDFSITLKDSIDRSSKMVSVQIFNIDNNAFGYVAGENKSTEVYKIGTKGQLSFLEQYELTNRFGGIRAITEIEMDSVRFLALSNKADNAIEIHKLKSNGRLERVSSTYDTDTTFIDETVTIHHININNRTFIYTGGLDKGISCFELKIDGTLNHIQSIEDSRSIALHGIIGMTSLVISGKHYLITGAFFDGGISSFLIQENGHLKNISNIMDDKKLFLNGAFPVNSVRLGDQDFILVGHRHNVHYSTKNAEKDYYGDGINVFKLNADGEMQLYSQLIDDDSLLLKGSTRIEIIKVDENKALVFIGTRDDKGVQVCSLQQDGKLIPISKVNLDYSIYNGMTVKKIENNWYLLIGAYDKNILELYHINLS